MLLGELLMLLGGALRSDGAVAKENSPPTPRSDLRNLKSPVVQAGDHYRLPADQQLQSAKDAGCIDKLSIRGV